MTEETKRCNIDGCGQQPLSAFNVDNSQGDHLSPYCRACTKGIWAKRERQYAARDRRDLNNIERLFFLGGAK